MLLEICQKGSIRLNLKQAKPYLCTEVITDSGWMPSRCLRNINEHLLQCRRGILMRSCVNTTFLGMSRDLVRRPFHASVDFSMRQ